MAEGYGIASHSLWSGQAQHHAGPGRLAELVWFRLFISQLASKAAVKGKMNQRESKVKCERNYLVLRYGNCRR
jgi:hypothetical protein